MEEEMIVLLSIAAFFLTTYIVLRFVIGFKRLVMIETMECDEFDNHHERREG